MPLLASGKERHMKRSGYLLAGLIVGVVWALVAHYEFYNTNSPVGLIFLPLSIVSIMLVVGAISEDDE